MRLGFGLVIAGTALCVGMSPGQAQWGKSDRDIVVSTCTKNCAEGGSVTPQACQRMCDCLATDTEKIYPDVRRWLTLLNSGDKVTMDRLEADSKFCAARVGR